MRHLKFKKKNKKVKDNLEDIEPYENELIRLSMSLLIFACQNVATTKRMAKLRCVDVFTKRTCPILSPC